MATVNKLHINYSDEPFIILNLDHLVLYGHMRQRQIQHTHYKLDNDWLKLRKVYINQLQVKLGRY